MQRKKQENPGSANAKLEKQLAEKILELEDKNRKLEIEGALEKVRVVAMAMKQRDDMLDICRIICGQLELLGITDIRNVQTAIIYPEKGIYINYEYYHLYNKTFITEVDYSHPIQAEFVERMLKEGASMVLKLEGEELREWFEYQKTTNQFSDPHLAETSSLNYYWFSIGPVALGISLYAQLSEDGLNLFKRFLDVFRLAYRRYKDIELAIAQTREAQIELALERVRAKAMAMQTSEELNGLIGIVFGELTKLDFVLTRCLIMIFDPGTNSSRWWMANSEAPADPMNYFVQYHKHPANAAYLKAWKERILKWRYALKGKVKKTWDDFLFVETELSLLPDFVIAGMKAPERVLLSASFNNFGCLTLVSLEPLSDEHFDLLLRFAKVFDMSYTRFNDLKQAEAQAREAKIQLALERVRARTMAMQQSGELPETAAVLFQQFNGLGITPERIFIGIINDNSRRIDFWGTEQGGSQMSSSFEVNVGATVGFGQIYKAWKAKKKAHTVIMKGKELTDHVHYVQDVLNMPIQQELVQGQRIMYSAFFSKGLLMIVTPDIQSKETFDILGRFAGVFDGTYTRFLDLQQAEAQAREAKIEAALERVRSRTMAMQKSEELREAIQLIYEQLQQLNFNVEVANFVMNYKESDDFNLWLAGPGQLYPTKIYIPYFNHTIFDRFIEAKEKGLDFYTLRCTFEEKNLFFNHFFKNIPEVSKERREIIYSSPGYAQSSVLIKNIILSIANYAAIPYSEAENVVLRRFAYVFEQTYTRFNDLKQAEAQAKEAKIEAGLERVRAKAMAMHSSEDLAETIGVFYHELGLLSVTPRRCGLGLMDKGTRYAEISTMNTTEQGESIEVIGKLNMTGHPVLDGIYDNWLLQKEYHPVLRGNEIKEYYRMVRPQISYPDYPNDIVQYGYFFFFRDGGAFTWTDTELPEDELQIYRRFNSVLSLTYRRYKDIKEAEAQAREAKIETALERVRSRTMAMFKSDELAETAEVLFQQFAALGIAPDRIYIGVVIEGAREMEMWATEQGGNQISKRFKVRVDESTAFSKMYDGWAAQKKSITIVQQGKELAAYIRFLREVIGVPIKHDPSQKLRVQNIAFFSRGLIGLTTPDVQQPETISLIERFAGVFNLTYTRFLDLQKAEEQAREAKIEAALERVRARAMSMHHSQDINAAVLVVFEELEKLDLEILRCGIGIIDKENQVGNVWTTVKLDGKSSIQVSGKEPMNIHPLLQGTYDAWLNKTDFSYELKSDDLAAYYRAVAGTNFTLPESHSLTDEDHGAKQYYYTPTFKTGNLYAFKESPFPDDAKAIMRRFASVLNLTFSRFIDLQKAEAQARESQIQLGLERVRAAAMAMHNSKDVGNATALVFSEFYKLGITTIRCGVCIIDGPEQRMEVWSANSSLDGIVNMGAGKLDMKAHPLWLYLLDAWEQKKSSFSYELKGKELTDYYKAIKNAANYHPPESDKPGEFFEINQYCNCYLFNEGCLFTFTEAPFSPEANQVLERFAAVFGLTYRRYLDLTKAEAQAREAKIEASLERVRGKAMAMRNSNDLLTAASTVFTELQNLGINQIRSGVGLIAKDFHKAKVYSATSSQSAIDLSLMGEVTLYGHPVFEQQYQSWLNRENYFVELEGAALASYYKILSAGLNADLGVTVKKNQKEYGHWFMFSEGFLYAWSNKEYTDAEIRILERFKNVMELTIRRYIELQKSETQAREAIRQASLDRVRAEIASMRTVTDLEKITPLIWNELTTLGVPFIRCGVFIMDEQLQQIHTYLSTPDGKAIAAFQLPFNSDNGNGVSQAALLGWRQKHAVAIHWTEEEFNNFSHTLVERGEIASEESYLTERPPSGLDLHFFPFSQGMLYAGNTGPLSDDDKGLVQSLADAFSTAYARYEDFNKLELAKQQVENTLTDLKAAQTRLVQSEKMASLGELTAGIAHEIQNPLNFVNNFSEVNQEMIDELEEALNTGNIAEALAIAADIKQNEQKINHHGKRADGIVKGMLQHSRSGGGEKVLTNINSVAEEYMRLSYHGLRAKDKSFNAEMLMNFDPELPRVEAVGQDIGRVFLNLFNNAFYAVNQKKKKAGADYKPEVSVTTLTENGQVIIKVKDNGVGMPDHVKEKIMQPFFTTKPTGEGTGLGLSLTYDMVVKGHGGSIQVNSVEGEGSEFIISIPVS